MPPNRRLTAPRWMISKARVRAVPASISSAGMMAQMMMNEIVCRAIAENNQALSREIGAQVEERVLKEMNYLMREREEQEEERFRKLDEAIRSRQRRGRKEKAAKRREKSGRIRLRTRESVS